MRARSLATTGVTPAHATCNAGMDVRCGIIPIWRPVARAEGGATICGGRRTSQLSMATYIAGSHHSSRSAPWHPKVVGGGICYMSVAEAQTLVRVRGRAAAEYALGMITACTMNTAMPTAVRTGRHHTTCASTRPGAPRQQK
jgi:hypothetical protein